MAQSIAERSDHNDSESSDSDSDAGRPILMPGPDATIEEMKEALKQEQIRNQKLMQKNKKLKGPKGLETKAPRKKSSKKPKSDNELPAELVDSTDQITRLGKKSAIMLCLWLPESVFRQQRPAVDYGNAAWRYANPHNQRISLIAELYDFVPAAFHTYLLGLPKFSDIMTTGASAGRSSSLYNLRGKAGVIFELDEKYFRGDHAVKDCDEIHKLLGYDKAKNRYDRWAPVLFPGLKKNMRVPFRNPSLSLILKIAFHGAGALNSVAKGKPKVNAQLWDVTSVNEASIAFAAIMARFLLSKDTEFVPTGAATGINYEKDYWVYRRMIASADSAARQSLFDFYNEVVFPARPRVSAKEDTMEDDEEDLTEALKAFNLGPDYNDLSINSGHLTEDETDEREHPDSEHLSPSLPPASTLPPFPSTARTAPHTSDAGVDSQDDHASPDKETDESRESQNEGQNMLEVPDNSRTRRSARAPSASNAEIENDPEAIDTRNLKATNQKGRKGSNKGREAVEKGKSSSGKGNTKKTAERVLSSRSRKGLIQSDEEEEGEDEGAAEIGV